MDISTQAVVDRAALHIKNAAGELLYADADKTKPVQIVIFGPGSEAAAIVGARQSARAIKRMEDNDGKIPVRAAEEIRNDAAEDLADMTASFNNFTYSPAGDAQGRDLFKAVYADQKLGFIVKQVSQAVNDWGKFAGA